MPWTTVNVELEDYFVLTNSWTSEKSIIHYELDSFASGGMRNAYKAYNCKLNGWEEYPMVLKMPNEGELQDENIVRMQIKMQAKCVQYANQYNSNPRVPKSVTYVPCRLVRFLSGPWQGLLGSIEQYIGDHFIKHNTVHPLYDGYALTERNTPQAFSHFTFEQSNKTEIVVDVQGVGDCYTDPQLYSVSLDSLQAPYGPADWGIMGVANFFRNHRCNAMCRALALDPIRTTDFAFGTQPRPY